MAKDARVERRRARRVPVDRGAARRLVVVDRLEVGPPRLTPRSLTATYRAVRGRRSHSIDLVYRYEEDVFDRSEPASLNLASLIAAQVALNYGLFCREIVFHGPLDPTDRRFLRRMAENTAREIWVKKLLSPNPFLRGEAAGLRPARRRRYLTAALRFDAVKPVPTGSRPASVSGWITSSSRHAVLSSGGKDSLLSFGLMREMGQEVHPVFVNESGRHWYTALNAYRHLAATCATTARVWTSADRVFTWMLRRLPFVRPDFARLRSDAYPIRLWTVAVFLFGALPLLRRRGIGRLLIGDEFDTTRRLRRHGIPHFDGLFDQSRWFDTELSAFFQRKGWGLSQFSILRPMSELVIQRILAQRYPDLLRQQVSCHAAHIRNGRIRPCGRCEKCRRIVGLLVAHDISPSACGYTAAQVTACLKALAAAGVHQGPEDARHLVWMLARNGRLRLPAAGGPPAQEQPQVARLRFCPGRSPIDGIPRNLRRPLYGIALQHALGAVYRRGRRWVPFNPLSDPGLARPYRFEDPPVARSALRLLPKRVSMRS